MIKQPALQKIEQEETGGSLVKEREFVENRDAVQLEELRREIELAPEVKEAGVELQHEEIELPPDIQQMGVEPAGPGQAVSQPTTTVPLQDDTIISKQKGSVWLSLTWLAQWCLRQLKKAHIKLKKVQGRIVRIIVK